MKKLPTFWQKAFNKNDNILLRVAFAAEIETKCPTLAEVVRSSVQYVPQTDRFWSEVWWLNHQGQGRGYKQEASLPETLFDRLKHWTQRSDAYSPEKPLWGKGYNTTSDALWALWQAMLEANGDELGREMASGAGRG